MHTTDDFILLINKSLTGEIQPDELDLLRKWIAQSPDNQQIEQDLRQIWLQSKPLQKTFIPNLDQDFAQVMGKIRAEAHPVRRSYLSPMLLRIAAAMVLLLASIYTWNLFSTDSVALQTAVALQTEKQYLELPDGSKVWLRKGAKLQYPAKFSTKDRQVALEGEAYFEVAHDPKHPFKVMVHGGGMIEVLGTSFEVNVAPQADEHAVYVRTGKVRYMPENNAKSVMLLPGNKATYSHATAQIQVKEQVSANELAWQTGGLAFVNTPLHLVITDLQQYFSVKIVLKNTALRNCPFTAPITNQSVEKVLEGLALVFDMKLENPEQGAFILAGGSCK